MKWESLGFKDDPLHTDPISQTTLPLYIGHAHELATCRNVLSQRNVVLVVEGARGVGTTSFANYLRFSEEKHHFTPNNEIRVEAGWTLETLLAVIIANIVRELELFHPEKVAKDERFQKAKALSIRISEAYRSFGVEAFGFGINYGKSAGANTQPLIVPSAVLGHHLEDLSSLIHSLGYRYGTLIQLNNLDIGAIHDERHMKYLFNALRDYIQTNGMSWILVGDVGLRRFIAQEVDRLDDIISYEVEILPLEKKDFEMLVHKRLFFYRINPKADLPIERDVFLHLYDITKGRLRYIFGLLTRLVNRLHVGDLTDRITLDIAKPMIVKLARDRIARNGLTPGEEQILKMIVALANTTTTALEKEMERSKQYISKILMKLVQARLVSVRKHGKNRFYSPEIDAVIAYSE